MSAATADSLAPDAVAAHLSGRFGRPYLYEPECESTQALLFGSSHPEGAVAATDHQTAGRGRLGRRWEAPVGTAVLTSVLLRPPAGRDIPQLALVAGLAAADTIDAVTGLTAQVKWPNDVMLDRRKVAGVLAELSEGAVVVGIGVNVNQTSAELPPETTVAAGSLRSLTGTSYDRPSLLAALLVSLERAYDAWAGGGLEALYDSLGARDFLRGRRVVVDGEAGVAARIARDGRLEVETDAGEHRVIESGEVLFER